jgi:CheY-like chemotaxis protein
LEEVKATHTGTETACSPNKAVVTKNGNGGEQFVDKYPLRILIAEDDVLCRRVLVLFLQNLGYQANSVENGLECLREALNGCYDLILSDINMPEMDGIQCASELRKAGCDAYIVAVTASSILNIRDECLRAGMNGFLPKPFNGAPLKEVLRDAYRVQSVKHALAA